MKRFWYVFLILAFATGGCSAIAGEPPLLTITALLPPTVTPGPPAQLALPPGKQQAVAVSMGVEDDVRTVPEVISGQTISVEIVLNPVIQEVQRAPDGTIESVTSYPWEAYDVADMRLCFAADAPCTPTADWQPFVTQKVFNLIVDWVGTREFYAAVQFRDNQTNPVPAVTPYSADLMDPIQVALSINSIANQDTPAAGQTGASPVSGDIVLEDGNCCVGGIAGSEVTIQAQFHATSTVAEVTDMRALPGGGGCPDEAVLNDLPWEPLVSEKTFTTLAALNWMGFYVGVQYRDSRGNLSPVYCDDISVEGMPPSPTS